jgi:hypothetical protein
MTAAWLARFAAEALAALQGREPDPIEDAERAAYFSAPLTVYPGRSASMTRNSSVVTFANRDRKSAETQGIPPRQTANAAPAPNKRSAPRGSVRPQQGRDA